MKQTIYVTYNKLTNIVEPQKGDEYLFRHCCEGMIGVKGRANFFDNYAPIFELHGFEVILAN